MTRLTDEQVAEIRATPSSWNELTVEGLLAELERERTQNLRLSTALRDLLDSNEADYYESADAARAALSTQEESK